MDKQFKTTYEHCKANHIHGVCSGCGGELEPLETVDNGGSPTFWAGCNSCQTFDNGVKPEIYKTAKSLVVNHHHVEYSHMDSPHDKDEAYKEYWRVSQIRGTCNTVLKILNVYKEVSNET